MHTLLLLGFLIITAWGLFYYANRLDKKEFNKIQDDHFKLLLDELKNIGALKFKVVSSEIIYSKTISVFLKVISYLLTFATLGLTLDFLTIKNFTMYDYGDFGFYLGFYLIASSVVFVLPLLSVIWNYTYFKYGVSDQIKNAHIIFDYLKPLPKKILSKYPAAFMVSYLIGRIVINSGFAGVLAGTVLYALSISIYFSLEAKRFGFAPLLNLISEKTKLFQGK